MTIALSLLAVLWWSAVVVLVLASRELRGLRPLTGDGPPGAQSVSVIVAARDESARIGATVQRLLDQVGVELQVIVVDDRSTDATPAILAALAERDARVEVLRIGHLPPGWLGKPHACHLGAARARGEWLLFADADVWLEPDVVARAVRSALHDGVDHVCLFPGERETTVAGGAVLLGFFMVPLPLIALSNRDRIRGPIGVGAFNLVRSAAYRRIGGHLPLRLEVIDDAGLGMLLGRAGYRTRAYAAAHEAQIRWAGHLPGVLCALEKNLFAAVGFSFPLAALVCVGQLLAWLGALAGLAGGSAAGRAAGAGLLALALPAALLTPKVGARMRSALLTPLLLPMIGAALARSAYSAWRLGGIRWRDTVYPLDLLRKGRGRFPNRSAGRR